MAISATQIWAIIAIALAVILAWSWQRNRQLTQQLAAPQLTVSAPPTLPTQTQLFGAQPQQQQPGVVKEKRAVEVNEQELQAYLADPQRSSVVMFYSPQCGHCERMMPDYMQYGQIASDRVHVLKVDGDRNQAACEQYDIRGFPTVKLFNQGRPVKEYGGDRKVGSLMAFAG